jgi:hypothetical protein
MICTGGHFHLNIMYYQGVKTIIFTKIFSWRSRITLTVSERHQAQKLETHWYIGYHVVYKKISTEYVLS